MGDPARLKITAIAVKYGWIPPEDKSDFDILPLVISDDVTGHDKPQIFPLRPEDVLEVPLEHPEHEAFSDLNLRWYALPAISNIGVDIGGVVSFGFYRCSRLQCVSYILQDISCFSFINPALSMAGEYPFTDVLCCISCV